MTLLVLLFVISSYVVIPWWAWALGGLKVSLQVVYVIQQSVERYKQHTLMKENEQYIAELANQYISAARSYVDGQDQVPPNTMN